MTQSDFRQASRATLFAACMAVFAAGHAMAQSTTGDPEPHGPAQDAPLKPHATSSLEATQPTAADEHKSRALAAAVFSRPAAAQRAADKASAASAPPIPPTDPKPEWLNDQGVRVGGNGLQVSKPF